MAPMTNVNTGGDCPRAGRLMPLRVPPRIGLRIMRTFDLTARNGF
jgi:hypothetical protein